MNLMSWNVNGIRAVQKKGFEESIKQTNPDVICLQETRAQPDQIVEAVSKLEVYQVYSNSAARKGYSGTTILTKVKPQHIIHGIDIHEHDQEGRVITAEFKDFYLVSVYVPNSGNELVRLNYRETWDSDFLHFLKNLEKKKPVIACGDFNVAHQEIDIARPKSNYNKTAGYTQSEIDGFSKFIEAGFVDTFRHLHPDTIKYSWWSYRANARAKNIGWRIDYCIATSDLTENIKDAFVLTNILGSDHCPVGLEISF